MRAELVALVAQWRANADTRDSQPKNKRDASAAVVYRICADEIEALLTKGPLIDDERDSVPEPVDSDDMP
jgi:hypothetical protein